jgi:hypothetical protein
MANFRWIVRAYREFDSQHPLQLKLHGRLLE